MTMYHYNREKIEENKKQLKAISMFQKSGGNNDTLGAIACGRFQDSYDVDFHSMKTDGGRLSLRIDLLN